MHEHADYGTLSGPEVDTPHSVPAPRSETERSFPVEHVAALFDFSSTSADDPSMQNVVVLGSWPSLAKFSGLSTTRSVDHVADQVRRSDQNIDLVPRDLVSF